MMRRIVVLLIGSCMVAATASLYLYREKMINGDNFKILVVDSDANSYSSWVLYYEDSNMYCMKFSRPIIPERICVPKADIEVRNSDDGRSRFGAIYKGEFMLKKDRYPGATEERF